MPNRIKLLIVDDQPVFRQGLKEVIKNHKKFVLVGEAPNGEEGLLLVAKLNPDLVLINEEMSRLNGFQMARTLRKEQSPVRIVFLATQYHEDSFNTALDLGVRGYLLKTSSGEELISALSQVAAGGTFYSSGLDEIAHRREERVNSLLFNRPNLEQLTAAEKKILKLIAEDRLSKEIATMLNISTKTVENHRANICNKLHVHGSHSLLKFAFDHKSYLS